MKLVKNLMATVVLVFALAVGSYAGDQQTPGYCPPPPPAQTPGAACSQETDIDNQEPCAANEDESQAPDPLMIDAITTLLSWF